MSLMKKLIPVLAVLAAALIAVSTGAFTSIEAQRTAEIYVAGDASALLTLEPFDGPNGAYVDYDTDGALFLDFARVDGTGVNVDAITVFSDVFVIVNNGTQDVTVTLSKTGGNTGAISFGDIESGVSVPKGESYTVSFTVTTDEMSQDDNILTSITLLAEA